MANRKRFNMEMGAYLKDRRRYDEQEVYSEFSKKKEIVHEDVPVMEPGEVHVEYEKLGFLRRLFAFKRREAIEQASDDLSEEEMERLRQMEGKVEAIEEEMTDLEEMEEEMEHERESLLSKIMSTLGFRKSYNVTEEEFDEFSQNEARDLVDDDLKHVLKITHSWIEKLPADKKKAFKESGDFDLYKQILQKYGLIRAKTPKKEEVKEEPKEHKEKKEHKETKPKKKATKKTTKKKSKK